MSRSAGGGFRCLPLTGIGEVAAGADLGALLSRALEIADGDILVVTSKVVSKAEGRVVAGERGPAVAGETDRVVARRAGTSIVRTHHGLVLAAAGIDASNTDPGTIVLLPLNPDSAARALRERVGANGGPNVAVVVTDTLGRAWRNGQVDIAIGAAGIEVLHDYVGMPDGYGNLLEVTAPAVADEIAGAADLAKGKLDGTPAAVVRGLGHLVTAPGVHGSGASALIRDEGQDMFGYGTREAVLQALHQDPLAQRGFGAAASSEEMVAALRGCCPDAGVRVAEGGAARVDVLLTGSASPPAQRALGADEARVTAVAFAMGWRVAQAPVAEAGPDVVLRFSAPSP